MMENLTRNWLVVSKLTWGLWRILTRALENLKKLHFNGLPLNKVYNVLAKKKYRRVLLDGTEYWCNIWRKTDLCFQKWHEEFSKFSPEHVWKSKNWNFDGILLSKRRKFMSWKFTGEICVITMKNDTKFEEELTCQFKIDTRNLTDFDPSTWKSQKSTL